VRQVRRQSSTIKHEEEENMSIDNRKIVGTAVLWTAVIPLLYAAVGLQVVAAFINEVCGDAVTAIEFWVEGE